MVRLAKNVALRCKNCFAKLARIAITNMLHIAWVSRTRLSMLTHWTTDDTSGNASRSYKRGELDTEAPGQGPCCSDGLTQTRNEPAARATYGSSGGHCSSVATTELRKALAWKASRARWSMVRVR